MESKLIHAMLYIAAAIFGFIVALAVLFYIEGAKPTDDEWK